MSRRRLRYAPFYRRDLLDILEVGKLAKLTTSQIAAALAAEEIPPPWFGEIPGSPIWLRSEIESWLARR